MVRSGRDITVTGLIAICLVLLLVTGSAVPAAGEPGPRTDLPDPIIALWKAYPLWTSDSLLVTGLTQLAFYYSDYLEDNLMTDSLATAAVRIAEKSRSRSLMALACVRYAEVVDHALFYRKSLDYTNQALYLCRATNNLPLRWRALNNLARIYLQLYDFDEAIIQSQEALTVARVLKQDTLMAESYLWLAKTQGYINQKRQAFTTYLLAVEMAEKSGNKALMIKCYQALYGFYFFNKLYVEAEETKKLEKGIIESSHPVDTTALMWMDYNLQELALVQKSAPIEEESVTSIIEYAIRKRYERLKQWEFAIYRRYLIETDDITRLYNLYVHRYPADFAGLRGNDPGMYYRLKAFFAEYEGKPDSADFFFRITERLVVNATDKNELFKAQFFTRYGQYCARHNKNRQAIEKFTTAFKLAESSGYPGRFDFMLAPCRGLELIYRDEGNYQMAWFYANANRQIYEGIAKNNENQQIMAGLVRQERSKREVAALRDMQTIRQGKTQRNMFAGGVVFFLIVSLLVFRNYRNQKRLNQLLDEARRRSDQLLHNILPHETAEELKSKGSAIAKRFDEVTVMFTDFKDFTQASEQMGAEDLVRDINIYFSEFDNIVTRHGIEKIKIIGDSYMCAGGLPVPNETHAHDVVLAALEFQAFMQAQRAEREPAGRPFFELRIGIHTGPVVAGIVGLKKFAYDIWGDTVNTASGMEKSGEPHKVNISGATHERVKEYFTCSYRGKVAAKHKGQVDMYFVDGPLNSP